MKILNIKISALPPENNSFWMKLLLHLCVPFLFIFGILLLIGWGIYSGISSIISAVKEDFFGIKDKTNIKTSKNILFENEQFKLKKEDYLPDENSQEYKIFDDFCTKSAFSRINLMSSMPSLYTNFGLNVRDYPSAQ